MNRQKKFGKIYAVVAEENPDKCFIGYATERSLEETLNMILYMHSCSTNNHTQNDISSILDRYKKCSIVLLECCEFVYTEKIFRKMLYWAKKRNAINISNIEMSLIYNSKKERKSFTYTKRTRIDICELVTLDKSVKRMRIGIRELIN